MTQHEMLEKMFKKQDELNTHTNGENWKNINIPWYRAIWVECSEMIDYTPWKWWKYGELKLDDIKVELVDIWHFGMSNIMNVFQTEEELKDCINTIEKIFKEQIVENCTIQEAIEKLSSKALTHQKFGVKEFINLCKVVNMNLDELYKLYMGKNILNKLRQELGYKSGNYVKIWNGQEDNYYMMKFLKEMNTDEIEEKLYNKLRNFYFETFETNYKNRTIPNKDITKT